jgi:hypothetical protein
VQDADPHELEVSVRLDGAKVRITSTLDTRPLYEWTGPITALDLAGKFKLISPPGSFTLGAHADDCVVSEVKAKQLGK